MLYELQSSYAPLPIHNETEKVKARNKDNVNSTEGECESCVGYVIKRDQYNLPSFQTKYEEAMFFVIKSYSEDDIHKSIKYNVWSSTLNGNKKLDSAYQESQKKIAEKGGTCPVFLFFSVMQRTLYGSYYKMLCIKHKN